MQSSIIDPGPSDTLSEETSQQSVEGAKNPTMVGLFPFDRTVAHVIRKSQTPLLMAWRPSKPACTMVRSTTGTGIQKSSSCVCGYSRLGPFNARSALHRVHWPRIL